MNKQQTISAIEAVLFASGDPISIDRLSQTFEIKPEEVEKYINFLILQSFRLVLHRIFRNKQVYYL